MSKKKEEGRKTQKGKFKNKLCFLAAAVAAGTITTEDKKLYGGNVCTVRVNGILTGNPTTLGSAPGTDAIACGNGAVANGTNSITTGTGAFTGYSGGIAIGENSSAVRESDIAIGTGAGLYNQGLNAKRLPNGNLNTNATRGYNVIIGANAMVGDDSNNPVYTSQGIAIGGSGSTRTGTSKNNDSGGAWAKGDQSIAIGGDTIAEGHSSIAIGGDDLRKAATKSVTYTLGSGSKTASLLTAMSDLAGVAASDINAYNATKAGSGAVALGVKSISGDLSLAIGTMSKANKVNATAVGTGAVADLDNSVAIGGGATTVNAAGTQETSATINGVTYSNFAGGSGTKVGDVVSIGKNGTFNRQIKNVAAGNISATSTDAVNGSQLYSVAQTLQDRFKYVSINSTETGNADNKGALATNSIAIGPNASATVTAENAVVVGNGAKTTEQVMNPGAPTQWTKTGKNSVVIGNKATTNSEGSVAIGHEAKVDNTTNNSGSTIGRYKNDDNSTYMGTSLAQNNIYADPSYVGTQGIAIGANSYSDYQGMSMGVGARSKNLSLALGYFSNAEGTSSIATGVGAYAKGDNSISSGRQSSTISTGSVALGVAARGGSTADGGLGGSIAVGAASDATHEQAIAIGGITNANTATLEQGRGDNTQATAARATAIGANAKAQAENSIAFGTKANVGSAGTNAVAIGKDSSATITNGVALGSESKATTAAGVTGFDMADGRSNVYSGLAGTAKTANMAAVSVGDGANKTRQITGVAAGKQDTDAVNVAQLKSTNLKIAGNTTSGGADVRLHDQTLTVKGDGTYLTSTAAGNAITMDLKQDVKDKINNAANKNLDNLNPAGVQKIKDTAAWNVVANSGTAQKVEGGDTVKFLNGDNIQITQAGKDFTIATKRDVNFNSVTVPAGAGNVVINNSGINAGGNKITNVDDGTANDHAVNLGQLNAVKNSPMKFGGDSGTDVDRKLGEKLNVKGGATGNLTNNNIAVEANGNDTLNIKLAENVDLGTNGSVKIGDSTLNNSGLTITGGPSITKTGGINAGGNKITNVADGTVGAGSTDAVNGGQLHDVKTSVTNNTTALNNLKSNTIKLSGDSTSTTAERLDKNGGIEFGVKSGDTRYLTSSATGTDITLDLTPDAKAKINKVATLSSNTISLGGDTGTTNTQALDKTGGIKFNVKGDGIYLTSNATNDDVTLDLTQATKNKINNAATNKLDNLDPAGIQKIKDTAAWNVVANNGTAEKVEGGNTVKFKDGDNIEITQNGKDFTFATKRDVNFNSVTVPAGAGNVVINNSGINAGGNKITNVDDGTANDHAVNLGQLNAVKNSPMKFGGDSGTDVDRKLGEKLNVKGGATGNLTNNNIAVEADGNDTLNIKLAENVNLGTNGSVKIGDSTLNNNGLTITGGPSITKTGGINAGGKTISNVADGTVGAGSTDAVNGGQLHDVKTSVTNNTTALNNLKSNTIKLSGDSTSTTAERLDKNGGIEFGVKSGDTRYLTSSATGTDITLDLTSDAKAKIDKATTLASNTVSLGGDTGTTNTQALDKTGGIKFNVKGDGIYLTSNAANDDVTLDLTQATKNKINNAATNKLDNLDPAGIQKIKDTAAWNVVANSGTAQKVEGGDTVKFLNGDNIQITQAGKDFTIATKRDVTFDSVTIPTGNVVINNSGINAGGNKITNVDDGTANDHAVNLGQLNAVKNSPMKFGGDSGTDVDRKLGEKLNIKGGATGNLTNNNIAVEADGNDTLNIKLAENVNLGTNGSVKIGDSTLNNDGLTITGGPSITKTGGINAGGKTISNVADGTANDHAVNLGQLNNAINNATATATSTEKVVASTAADNIATVAPSTGQNLGDKNATYEVTVSKTAVQNIAKDAAAWNVVANSGTAQKVEGGDTVKFLNGDNIQITQAGKDFTIATKRDVTFDSVTIPTGNVVINNSGINAGGNKITNVDDGTANDHAVNLGQLNAVKNSPIKFGGDSGTDVDRKLGEKLNIKGGATGNLTNNNIAVEADGNDTLNIKLAENVNLGTNGSVKIGDSTLNNNGLTITGGPSITKTGGINAGGKTISNVADGTANDHAVNLGQLNNAINNATATATSTEKVVASTAADNIATVAPSTGQNLGDKNATYEVTVSKTAVQNIAKDAAAWNVVANSGTAQKVEGGDTVKFLNGDNIQITQAGKDFTIATKRDVTFDSVTIPTGNVVINNSGINAGGKTISNVANGTDNDHAVNLGQLNAVKNSPIKFGGDSGTDVDRKLGEKLNIKGGATGNLTSNNIAVEADGNDTLNIKLAENVNLGTNGSVKIGDSTLNNDGLTITGGPSITKTGGINAGGNKITNVADGIVGAGSTDAVNGGQLHDVKTSVTNNTTALNNLKSNTIKLSGDSTSTTAERLDKNGGIEFGVKSGDTRYLTSTATGTDITLDLTSDAKAKIDKATTLASNTVSLGGDTGTTNTQSLDKTGGIKFNVKGDGTYLTSNAANDDVTLDLTQATKNKINNAATNKLDNLDPAGIQKIKDTAAWNVVANSGTAQKVEGGDTVKFLNGDNIQITQAGKDFTFATKRDVNFNSITVPAGAGNIVINNSGINAGNNKITNVDDGTIAPGSKEAVNGGQLHDVQSTMNAGTFTVSANGGAKDRIAKDENIDFENADGNIAISYDATGNKFTYNLSPNLNLGPAGSLRIGDALLNNGGLTIVNGPSITSAGVDAGNKKITNVADGTIGAGSKDAINGGQLHDVQTNLQTSINNNAQNIANNTNAINNLNTAVNNPITFTGDSGNNIDRKLGETLNIKGGATGNLTSGNIGVEADSATNTLNVKLAENIDLGTNGSVKTGDTKIDDNGLTINGGPSVTKAGIDAGNKKVTNVANGDITATSKDAVNGSQLHGVADSIKNSIGGNTILNPDGTITTNNIGGTGHNNIHDAIASVNNAANQRTTVVAGDNIDVTVSTNATGGNEYTVATKRDIVVDSVSVANNGPSMNSNGINAGGKTISNLGAGVNPNDAVNVAQLDAVKNSPITFGADTGTDHAATLGSRVSITGDNKNITTSISGNNIQVAMSETPSFGTVNINDANTGTITGASNVTLDNLDEDGTVGRVATEAQLAAVRNEVAGTKDIDNKLRGFKKDADAGTASAMAMAGIPQVINPGENAIGASISAYKHQTAVAVGYTRASKNGRAVLKISGSVNSNSELGFSLGFMKGWD